MQSLQCWPPGTAVCSVGQVFASLPGHTGQLDSSDLSSNLASKACMRHVCNARRSTVTADFRSPLDTPVARTRLGMSGSAPRPQHAHVTGRLDLGKIFWVARRLRSPDLSSCLQCATSLGCHGHSFVLLLVLQSFGCSRSFSFGLPSVREDVLSLARSRQEGLLISSSCLTLGPHVAFGRCLPRSLSRRASCSLLQRLSARLYR